MITYAREINKLLSITFFLSLAQPPSKLVAHLVVPSDVETINLI